MTDALEEEFIGLVLQSHSVNTLYIQTFGMLHMQKMQDLKTQIQIKRQKEEFERIIALARQRLDGLT